MNTEQEYKKLKVALQKINKALVLNQAKQQVLKEQLFKKLKVDTMEEVNIKMGVLAKAADAAQTDLERVVKLMKKVDYNV
jgi:hypothetical protein